MKKLFFSVCAVLAILGCSGENVDELPLFRGEESGGDSSSSSGGSSGSSSSGSQFNPNIEYISFTDARDSITYKSVTIGTQTWMAENLNYAEGGKCYGEDGQVYDYSVGGYITLTPRRIRENCAKYGRLYDWETVMAGSESSTEIPSGVRGICPLGWHLPSDEEWSILTEFVETDSECSDCAGIKLKSAIGWNGNGNGTNDYGFSAMPGSYGDTTGNFANVGNRSYWWSASEDTSTEDSNSDAYYCVVVYNSESAIWYSDTKSYLLSVRCVKDEDE